MEVPRRAFLLVILVAAIASQDILIPVLGWCGSSPSPCSSLPRRGGYYPPAHTPSPKPPSSTPPKSSSPTPKSSSPSPKMPSPSPCSKYSCHASRPPTTPSTPTPSARTPSPKPPAKTPLPQPPAKTPSPQPPTTPAPAPPTPTTPVTQPPAAAPPMPPFLSKPPLVGPCTYWLAHPDLINQILGMWGSAGHMFAAPPFPSMFGGPPSVPQALQNTGSDCFSCLLRECAAALLNSISGHQSGAYPYSTSQVQTSFLGALSSESAAAAQAEVFKAANEGRFH